MNEEEIYFFCCEVKVEILYLCEKCCEIDVDEFKEEKWDFFSSFFLHGFNIYKFGECKGTNFEGWWHGMVDFCSWKKEM